MGTKGLRLTGRGSFCVPGDTIGGMTEVTVKVNQRTPSWPEGSVLTFERTAWVDKLLTNGVLSELRYDDPEALALIEEAGVDSLQGVVTPQPVPSPSRPPASGAGSGRDAWAEYYRALNEGVDAPAEWSRDMIREAIEGTAG